jgi:DNA helicase II / ATP-dependent DNA helicase PcrA
MSPWAALTALCSRQLALLNAESLKLKFEELKQILDDLQGANLQQVVDTLLPAGSEGVRVLRDAALLALERCESAADLFESLKTTVTQPEMPEEGDFVRIMSLHKSKGLTSKVAILVGCTRGFIPFEDRDESPQERAQILSEQRRLFYVAITRCTEILVLSSALRLPRDLAFRLGARVLGRGDPVSALASPFIGELGPTAPQPRSGWQWKDAGYT